MCRNVCFFTMILLFTVISCTDSTSSNENSKPPDGATDLYQPTISISENHPDSYAQNVKFTVEVTSIFQLVLTSLFEESLPWKEVDDHWEYRETEGNLTNILELYDGEFDYEIVWVLDGTDDQGNTYDNMSIFQITQGKDGKSGSWTVYDMESSTPYTAFTYVWSLNTAGIYSATMTAKDITGGVIGELIISINSVDGSGTYSNYSDDVLIEMAVWNADGSGSMTSYYTDPPTVYTWGPNPTTKNSISKEEYHKLSFQEIYKQFNTRFSYTR